MGAIATLIIPLAISVGGYFLQRAFMPKQKDQYGSRVSDLNVGTVSPGNPIIRHWGTMKLPTQLVWTSRLIETAHVEQAQGKGGGGGPTSTTYTYSVHAAHAICAGPIKSVNRIWANAKLLWVAPEELANQQAAFDAAYYAELDRLYNQAGLASANEAYASAFFFAFNNYRLDQATLSTRAEALAYIMAHPGTSGGVSIPAPNSAAVDALLDQMLSGLQKDQVYQGYKNRFDQIDIYLGSDYQMPNALLESYLGVGNVPAFRRVAYFVMHKLQLEDFGNAMPTFTVEVTKSDGEVELRTIVSEICQTGGLTTDQFDVGRLPNQPVQGYAVTTATSTREALSGLQKCFGFDAAESAYKIVFKWINSRPVATIRREDLGARVTTETLPVSEDVVRMSDYDLPKRVNLKFQEPVRNYSSNTVHAIRQQTLANAVEEIEATVALTVAQAKTAVEEQMVLRFCSRRMTKIKLPSKYVVLEPGDPVYIPDRDVPGQLNSFRIIEQDIGVNGIIEATLIDHHFHEPLSALVADDFPDGDTGIAVPLTSPTYTYLLDMPLLADSEADEIGFYAIMNGSSNGWKGATLMINTGSGGGIDLGGGASGSTGVDTWANVVGVSTQLPHGVVFNHLGPGKPLCWDYGSRIRVYLRNREIALSNASERDIMVSGLNVCIIGEEYVAYSVATDLGNGLWELSGFLRGLRGTESKIGTHVDGEKFLRVSRNTMKRVTHDVKYLNKPGKFRGISYGDAVDSETDISFADTGVSLKPRSPYVYLATRADPSGDVMIKWTPCNRVGGNWITHSMPVALDQASEQYEIEIVQGGLTLEKSQSGRTLPYSAPAQSSDGLNYSLPATFRIWQIGATIGRGFVTELTI